ncbi:MAG TPA: glycosyltransferase 87 family protein, partial [Anaerolineales bacterium]|nr:glycosyltransferase 87 family protein [Anaerolineales bacterium]
LYLKGSLEHVEAHYLYSPAFAFLFAPLLLLPLPILLPVMVVIHLLAYGLLYVWWGRIFEQNSLPHIARQWAQLLPLYLVFSAFWDDLSYMNTYIIVALFATLLIDAILQERLGWAAFWLGAVILPIKPHWAFALALPLLLGRYRFFLQLLVGAAVAYLIVAGITVLAGGVEYGIRQYQDYFSFLSRLTRDYPWWGPDKPFLGYNHSIMQIVLYMLGVSPANMTMATILKLILLLPLGWISLKFLRNPVNTSGRERSETALALIFAFYLGAFIWLDMVWELSLGIVIFAYLLATTEHKGTRVLLWLLFGPYALLDIWRLVSYMTLGDSVLYEGAYVLTDPLIYIPWIMMVLLVFYGLLLVRLNRFPARPS